MLAFGVDPVGGSPRGRMLVNLCRPCRSAHIREQGLAPTTHTLSHRHHDLAHTLAC